MIVKWTQPEIAAMTVDRARELREQIRGTVMASDQADRMSTFNLIFALDRKIGQAPASVEARAASARAFLHPTNALARQRAFDVATNLYGSAKAAQKHGYKDPSAS